MEWLYAKPHLRQFTYAWLSHRVLSLLVILPKVLESKFAGKEINVRNEVTESFVDLSLCASDGGRFVLLNLCLRKEASKTADMRLLCR